MRTHTRLNGLERRVASRRPVTSELIVCTTDEEEREAMRRAGPGTLIIREVVVSAGDCHPAALTPYGKTP